MPKSTLTSRYAFPLLGEPLALDLVNTCILRRGQRVDLLERPSACAAWLRAEHRRIAWKGRVDAGVLDSLRALRDATDVLLRAQLAHAAAPRAALRRFNHALTRGTTGIRLDWTSRGPCKALPAASDQRAALIHTLAVDALEVLTGSDAGLLRECAHPDCRLLFIARNHRRRWCSSATCGNRARVARHGAIARRTLGRR